MVHLLICVVPDKMAILYNLKTGTHNEYVTQQNLVQTRVCSALNPAYTRAHETPKRIHEYMYLVKRFNAKYNSCKILHIRLATS